MKIIQKLLKYTIVQPIKWMYKKVKQLTYHKQIIYSKRYYPAELVKVFTVQHGDFKGRKFARVMFTNRRKDNKTFPVTDVAYEDILMIKIYPNILQVFFYRLLKLKPPIKRIGSTTQK
jgi:hypothetical protein